MNVLVTYRTSPAGAERTVAELKDAATAEAVRRATPLERLGNPDEIARAVRFFVDSGFATGAILTVDGGRLIA